MSITKEFQSAVYALIESATEQQLNIDNEILFPIINTPQFQTEIKKIDKEDARKLNNQYIWYYYRYYINFSFRGMDMTEFKFKNYKIFFNNCCEKIENNSVFDNKINRLAIVHFLYKIFAVSAAGKIWEMLTRFYKQFQNEFCYKNNDEEIFNNKWDEKLILLSNGNETEFTVIYPLN
jgi:hypothetical protein